MFTTFDVIALVVIALVFLGRCIASNEFGKHVERLESLGYTSGEDMMVDSRFRIAARHCTFWSNILHVLLIGYTGSWVLYWLS